MVWCESENYKIGLYWYVRFNNIYKTNLAVPNTGGWQSWQNTATATVSLDSGPQIMTFIRLGVEKTWLGENFDFNLNKFTLTYIGGNGDMDLDGDIDLVDYAQFASHWQQTGCGTCGGAELTGDGNVLIEDLVAFCDNWLGGL